MLLKTPVPQYSGGRSFIKGLFFNVSVLKHLKTGTRCDDDVTVGGTLLQAYGLLFLQHQQTEERGRCVGSTAILTHFMKAECGIRAAVLLLL